MGKKVVTQTHFLCDHCNRDKPAEETWFFLTPDKDVRGANVSDRPGITIQILDPEKGDWENEEDEDSASLPYGVHLACSIACVTQILLRRLIPDLVKGEGYFGQE